MTKPTSTEYIIILDTGVPHMLPIKSGFMPYSLIEEHVVRDRFPAAVVRNCPSPIPMRYNGVMGPELMAYEEVLLTWHRNDSGKTHKTVFYLVSNLPDTDVLLGNDLSNGL
jgi:hypothetical protein